MNDKLSVTVKLQIFVRYLFSYFRLETGSYVLIFVLSRVCEENDVEIQWLQSKKKFSYDIKFRTFQKYEIYENKYRTKICDFTVASFSIPRAFGLQHGCMHACQKCSVQIATLQKNLRDPGPSSHKYLFTRARKIFSVPVAEFFGPSPGAIFLVAFSFILVAVVRPDSKV